MNDTMILDLLGQPADDLFDLSKYSPDELKTRMPPGQTLAKKFPHLEYASIPCVKDPYAWPIDVTGFVAHPMKRTLREFMGLPVSTFKADFHCITGWSILDAEWLGVSGRTLCDLVQADDDVTSVMVKGMDEFSTTLWLEDFMAGIVAFAYRGKPLSDKHGFPLRFIAPPHLYQYKSCKWVTGIDFMKEHKLGFWEIRAYSDSAKVWENDRYANPFAVKGKSAGQIRREAIEKAKE